MVNPNGTGIQAVDGGTYMYKLDLRMENGEKIWFLNATDSGGGTDPETTPSTDAILSLGMSPLLIMGNEMDNLRFRKGSLDRNADSSGAWVRMIGNKTEIDKRHAGFDLDQYGFEMGADKLLQQDNGKWLFGGFFGYSASDVDHNRGGKSDIDTFSLGAYATYFANTGWYIDNVLKYSRFDVDVNARSTQGDRISGDYKQNGFGFSVEGGHNLKLSNDFWVEPYVKLTYLRIDSEDLRLSNGMTGRIDAQDSFTSELGVSAGKDFTLQNGSTFSPYAKVAWTHEFIDNNKARINGANEFDTSLPKDYGRIGLVKTTNRLSFFGEFNYRKGNNIESPIQANVGLRYNF